MSKNVYFVMPEYEALWRVSLNGVATPTGPTYLYTFAKSINFGNYDDGKCIDFAIHDKEKFLSELKKDDLICVTTIVSNYKNTLDLIRKAKEKGAKCAIGGPWATAKYKQIEKNQPLIDYIAVGEGEPVLEDLLLDKSEKGIIIRKPTPVSELPEIDLSCWLDKDLQQYYQNYVNMLNTGAYGPVSDEIPMFAFYQSSRGCTQKPRCGFCDRLGLKYNSRTGEQISADIKDIANYLSRINLKVHIFDCSDSFMAGIQNLKGRKNERNVTMTIYSRADEVTPENADILQDLGVKKVSIGVETGSEEMMDKIGKGVKIERHKEAASLLKERGISIYVNLMYGIPDETPEDLQKTVRHFDELASIGNVYRVAGRMLTPLPNSRWYFDLINELERTEPELAKEIHNSDFFDPNELREIWLKRMTNLSMSDIEYAHQKIVARAKEIGASISSETPRGIV